MKEKNARLMLIISMTIFGTIGLFVRYIPLASGEIALYRAVLAAVLLGGYLCVTHQGFDFSKVKKEIVLLLLSGAAMGINWILLFESYRYTTVSVATLSYYFAPVIVTVLCPVLFKEKLTKKQVVCFIGATVGLVLITGLGAGKKNSDDILGIAFGLGAACFYATVVLLNKFIKNVGGIHRTILQFLAAIVVLLPYVLLTSGVNVHTLATAGIVALLVVGLVHTGITYCLYFSSLKELQGQKVAVLSYIDPLVAVFVSVVLLGESMSIWQILGGICILGFTLWNEM